MKRCLNSFFLFLQPLPTSPTSTSPTPGGTLGMSKMDAPNMQDVYILSPVSGLYGTRSGHPSHSCWWWLLRWLLWSHWWVDDGLDDTDDHYYTSREELGLMSCDDISRYSSQSGSKGSEAVSYYLDQESGQYFSLLEADGPPGPDYDRGRNTGVRRRDKTPTHGKKLVENRSHRSPVCFHQCLTVNLFSSHSPLCWSLTSWLCFMSLPHVHTKNTDHMTQLSKLPVCSQCVSTTFTITHFLVGWLSRDSDLQEEPISDTCNDLKAICGFANSAALLRKRIQIYY